MAPQKYDAVLQTCLNQFFYEDGLTKPLSLNTLQFVAEAKENLNEAGALLLEGVLHFVRSAKPFKYLSQATEKGCDHPLLHYCLGECYRRGDKGVAKDATKAFECYDKAVGGR